MRCCRFAVAVVLCGLSATHSIAGPFALDAAQTEISFNWEFAGTEYGATFERFAGTVRVDPDDLGATQVDIVIDPTSVQSGVDVVDELLQSSRFFAVADHPQIVFAATEVRSLSATKATLVGDLTIKGITRPVALTATVAGVSEAAPAELGEVTIVATTSVIRHEWDLGGFVPLTSDGVRITIDATLRRNNTE